VLGVVEGQPLGAVVVHHLGDAGEHAAAPVQRVAALLGLRYDDVNAPLAGPARDTHTHKHACTHTRRNAPTHTRT